MPNHWIDELVWSKNTVDSATRIILSAFCSSSCFNSTCGTESGSIFRNPSTQTDSSCSAPAFTHSFNSDFSFGTRSNAPSDKKACRTSTNHLTCHSASSSNSTTPFRSRSGSTHAANGGTGTHNSLSCGSRRDTTCSASTAGSSSDGVWRCLQLRQRGYL